MTRNVILIIVVALLAIGIFFLGFNVRRSADITSNTLASVVVADQYIDLVMNMTLLEQLDQGNIETVRNTFCTGIAIQVIKLDDLLPSCNSETADMIRRSFARVARHMEKHPFPEARFEERAAQVLNAALLGANPDD